MSRSTRFPAAVHILTLLAIKKGECCSSEWVAKSLGTEFIVNVDSDDVRTIVDELTEGYGADVVFEGAATSQGHNLQVEFIARQAGGQQSELFFRPGSIQGRNKKHQLDHDARRVPGDEGRTRADNVLIGGW